MFSQQFYLFSFALKYIYCFTLCQFLLIADSNKINKKYFWANFFNSFWQLENVFFAVSLFLAWISYIY